MDKSNAAANIQYRCCELDNMRTWLIAISVFYSCSSNSLNFRRNLYRIFSELWLAAIFFHLFFLHPLEIYSTYLNQTVSVVWGKGTQCRFNELYWFAIAWTPVAIFRYYSRHRVYKLGFVYNFLGKTDELLQFVPFFLTTATFQFTVICHA